MKHSIAILLVLGLLASCNSNSQTKATEKLKEIQAAIKPGTIAASAAGYKMMAKVNGKQWTASSLMPPETAGRIVGYSGKEYIGLPYNKQYLTAGKKITLGEEEAADIFFKGVGLATTKSGQMEIIKVDGKMAEGKFYFTCVENATGKTIEVTEGFFRIVVNN
jgi:hypothetical protein